MVMSNDCLFSAHPESAVAAVNARPIVSSNEVRPAKLVENVLALKSNNTLALDLCLSADGAGIVGARVHGHI